MCLCMHFISICFCIVLFLCVVFVIVVTFKKINTSTPVRVDPATVSRKRKKPGQGKWKDCRIERFQYPLSYKLFTVLLIPYR